jgi:hypothetical protein
MGRGRVFVSAHLWVLTSFRLNYRKSWGRVSIFLMDRGNGMSLSGVGTFLLEDGEKIRSERTRKIDTFF